MELSHDQLYILYQCAISAAYRAGHLIASYAGKDIEVMKKSEILHEEMAQQMSTTLASQVVTEVDHMSQDVILGVLKPTLSMFDIAILTEESPDNGSRFEKDYFWCIDPLDGTLPFVESRPGYSVSIALVNKKGEPLIGVIYDPVENNLYHAMKGSGAFKNEIPLHEAQKGGLDVSSYLTFYTDRTMAEHKNIRKIVEKLDSMAIQTGLSGVKMEEFGGAALNTCKVLENDPACYFKLPKKESGGGSLWDYAAAACIFQESGSSASDIYGDPLDLNRKESTYMNHKGALFANSGSYAKEISDIFVGKG